MPGNIINLKPSDIAQWPAPNYDNPVERNWMPVYASVFYGASTIMVGMRIWLRISKYSGGFGTDDAILICSWLCVTAFTVLAIVGAEVFHTNRHLWDIPITGFVGMARVTWLAELFFLLTGCCVKVSVLLFYRRLVENTCSRYWIWAVIFAISMTVAYSLAFILALVFNCTPTDAYWKAFDLIYAATVEYHCTDTTVINLLAGVMAIVSDLYAVALPCIMMRDLNLPLRQKIALNLVFSLGLLVVAASSVRTYWLWKCGHTPDVSTAIFNVFVWSLLELNLGIMCAAAPALRVVFREYLSEPLARLKNSVKSATSATRSRRHSEGDHVIFRRVESPEYLRRQDSDTKDAPNVSVSSNTFSGPTMIMGGSKVSQSPTAPDWERNDSVQSPHQSERHNLHGTEKCRRSSMLPSCYSPGQEEPAQRPDDLEMQDMSGHSWLREHSP